jgi:hypothetical protein
VGLRTMKVVPLVAEGTGVTSAERDDLKEGLKLPALRERRQPHAFFG